MQQKSRSGSVGQPPAPFNREPGISIPFLYLQSPYEFNFKLHSSCQNVSIFGELFMRHDLALNFCVKTNSFFLDVMLSLSVVGKIQNKKDLQAVKKKKLF